MLTTRKAQRGVALGMAILSFLTVLTVVQPKPALADPACNNGGAYVVFARGSGADLNSNDASTFKQHISYEIQRLGLTVSWSELGNIDGSVKANAKSQKPDDANLEYPATKDAGWIVYADNQGIHLPGYPRSVAIGTNELVNHLNDRTVRCPREAIVLGGYSQGADVIGWALERTGHGGHIALTPHARQRIAFAALYGDPKFNAGELNERLADKKPRWVRGDAVGYTMAMRGTPQAPTITPHAANGLLGPRTPYAPADIEHRMGSWCDKGDQVCNGNLAGATLVPWPHVESYRNKWYAISAHEIREAVRSKAAELTAPQAAPAPAPPPTSGPPLYFVKIRNTGSGRVEVHSALPHHGYNAGTSAVTRFSTGEQHNGWFQMVGSDLWYIKTKHTGSGRVELHSATHSSGYTQGESRVTRFSVLDQDNGWFQMVGTELFFIKTKNVGSGRVEVHSATRGSNYQSGHSAASWIPAGDHSNGWFQMLGADLCFVKTRNVGPTGKVELHWAFASEGYSRAHHQTTRFHTNDRNNGWFQVIHRDVWFIKTHNAQSQKVEIHSATQASGYTAGQGNASWFSPGDHGNGWWQVGVK